MKISTKITLGLVAVVVAIGAYKDLAGRETTGLANAHRASGYSPSCETLQAAGKTWALCAFERSAPSVWLKRGEAWAAANGPAQMVVEGVEKSGQGAYQNLPRIYVDRQQPVYMTDSVRARMDEIRAEIAASR